MGTKFIKKVETRIICGSRDLFAYLGFLFAKFELYLPRQIFICRTQDLLAKLIKKAVK